MIVTRDAAYDAAWPDARTLDLPATLTPTSATLHVHVAPEFSPPRLAVGAILTTDRVVTPLKGRRARGELIAFGHARLEAAIADRIAGRLGATLVSVPAAADARAREAQRLGDARAAACGVARLLARDTPGAAPTLVSQVKPMYPRPELERRRGGVVQVAGEVTEHGTLTALEWRQGVEDANLVGASTGAASLWRFVAPIVDACPARRQITIEMSFEMR